MSPDRTRKLFLTIFSVLVLLACQLPNIGGVPFVPPTPTSTLTLIPTLTATTTLTATETSAPTITPTLAPRVHHVLILSIDGLRPDAISLAPMKHLLALMQSGAYSLTAQTVYPSVTLVAHTSMLSGLCPSKHGVNWDQYLPERGYAQGTDLFDIAHAAGLKTEMYVGTKKLIQITEHSSLDNFVFVNDRESVLMKRLIEEFPQDFGVLFIHFATADGMGHSYGWLSPQQLNFLVRDDQVLNQLLKELDKRNLRNDTLIIVTSDHGGHASTHGSDSPEDMTIPWIAVGPGIQPKVLTSPIHIMDTAATAAFALGLKIPAEWDGVPVYEAFGLPVEKQSIDCQ